MNNSQCSCGNASAQTISASGSASAGEPIDIGSGNVFETVTDYTTVGQNPLQFIRSYNSLLYPGTHAVSLGLNWRSNYDRYLNVQSAYVAAERDDGRVLYFTLNNGAWTGDTNVDVTLTQSGTTWTLTDQNDTIETYTQTGSEGVLQSIKSRNGYTQTLMWSSGRLIQVQDSYGRHLGLTYTGPLLTGVTTPDSATSFTYGYASVTGGSVLTSVGYSTSPATVQTYVYSVSSAPSLLTAIKDEDGNVFTSWTYDGNRRGLTSQRGNGTSFSSDLVTITYNDTDGSRTVTNALGQTNTYQFQMMGDGVPKVFEEDRGATSTTAAGTLTLTYDTNGYVASRTDWNGNTTSYTNNAHGLPTTIVEASGSSQARTTTVAYDATWVHLPDTITTPGLTIGYSYDSHGNPLTRVLTDTTSTSAPYSTNGQTRTWTYTWLNDLLTSVQQPRTDLIAKTQYGYDSTGALTSIRNALNQQVSVTAHTGGGLPTTIVDANGVTTTLTYNPRLWLTSSTIATSAGNLATTLAYDNAGNLLTLIRPDGSALNYTYDIAHRLTNVSNSNGEKITLALDAMGDRTSAQFFDVSNTQQFQHSGAFDTLGRLLKDTGGAGQVTQYAYDGNGNALTITDPLTRVTGQAFDALNRLSTVTDPTSHTIGLTYDAYDRPLTATDQNGNVTSYVYDGFGDVIQRTSPDSGVTVYHYNGNGDLTQMVDAAAISTNQTFDALDRPLTRTYPADAAETVSFSYDQAGHGFGIGRLTSLTDAAGSLSRSYDEQGNLLTDKRTSSAAVLTTAYAYDKASRVSSITYPSGSVLTYSRDHAGQINSVQDHPSGTTSNYTMANATHKPYGPLNHVQFGTGIGEAWTFDQAYRPTSIVDANGSVNIQSLTYAYDADDNVKTITDGVIAANSQSLTYDMLNQLTAATGSYGSLGYSYDPVGNRLTQTLASVTTNYGYTVGTSRLASLKIGGTTASVTTNADGNITAVPSNGGVGAATTLTYNNAQQMKQANAPGQVASYVYDAFGYRQSKAFSGSPSIMFTYDQGGNLLAETQVSGSTVTYEREYLTIDNRLVAGIQLTYGSTNANFLNFYHADRLGTPQLVTNAGTTTAWKANYQPFGSLSIATSTVSQFMRMPGQYADGETGFSRNGFRDYMPSLGRYLQTDPIGLGGGMNTYGYVGGNPAKWVDPLGLIPPGADQACFDSGVCQCGTAECAAGMPYGPDAPGSNTGSFGLIFNLSAEAGWGSDSNALNGFSGFGFFPDSPHSLDSFVGGSAQSPKACYPSSKGTNEVYGAYAGIGMGPWISNATNPNDFAGLFAVTNINTPIFSFQYATGGDIWVVVITYGYGPGATYSHYNTYTFKPY